jgi:hypothetical protein
MTYARQDDSNSNDGGRFAVSMQAAPEPTARSVMRERSEKLAPKPAEPEPTQVAALAQTPARVVEEKRPALVDAPIPLARPRGLSVPVPAADPAASAQLAALAAAAGPLAFAPPGSPTQDQRLILASLPPRRPDAITALIEGAVAGRPTSAPVPPARPVAFANLALADLRGTETPPQTEGKLVTVTHPLPPGRPRAEGVTQVAMPSPIRPTVPTPTPIVAQYDADRTGLDSLFAAVARTSTAPEGKSVTIATARTRSVPSAGSAAPIRGPSPAAALGFSHAEPSDAKTGSFSGPAVRALPTNFIQN